MKTIEYINSKLNNFLDIQWGTEEAENMIADRRMIWDDDIAGLNKFYEKYKGLLDEY